MVNTRGERAFDMTSTARIPRKPTIARPIGELSGLHRHLLGPKPPPRPCTSYGSGSQAFAVAPKLRLQPPPTLLPPYAPPRSSRVVKHDQVLLPSIAQSRQNPQRCYKRPPRRTVARCKTVASSDATARTIATGLVKRSTVDASTGTDGLPDDNDYICRLCGFNCQSGDMLHSHVLLLRHTAIGPTSQADKTRVYDTLLTCRHCGVNWQLNKDEKRTLTHPCLLQKSSYFKSILAPSLKVHQGLPFVCLFCCAEDDARTAGCRRRPNGKKSIPLKPHHTASRFASKLELALHIRYMHTPTRDPGCCSGCPNFKYDLPEKQEASEFRIWERTPSPASSPTPSTDSILDREGLHPLQTHITDTHLEGYEYLAWLISKRRRGGPTDLGAHTTTTKTAWMYACPFCQLQPFKDCSSRPEMGLSSNSMLQTHIACFHAAGASFLDWKLQVCQVCGEAVTRSEAEEHGGGGEVTCPLQRHIAKRGHLGRVRERFSKSVNQGRVMLASETAGVEWRTTCVICWRRFDTEDARNDVGEKRLRAECRLQAHLLSTHCLFTQQQVQQTLGDSTSKRPGRRNSETNVFSCGWCGGLRDEPAGQLTGVSSSHCKGSALY